MPIDVPQNEKVEMGMLKECVLDVVKKGIMPIAVQQSIKEQDPVMRDYTVSSVEKMDILLVDVKKKIIINSMIEVYEDLRGNTRHPSQREAIQLYSNHFVKAQRNFFNRWANDAKERMGK